MEIEISGRRIGAQHSPYVIAEVSANHNGQLKNALKLIYEAKVAGADAVKLQTYRPDTITLDIDKEDFKIHGGLWDGRTLFDLYREAHMPWEWHKELFDYSRELGLTIFSSPFDASAIDLLEDLNAPAYKIASFEAVDLPLIRYAAKTGKPLIISTGLAGAEEIGEAIEAARCAGGKQLALLHCVSGYPAPAKDYNLRTVPEMAKRFGLPVGLSDHTLDITTSIASVAVGACIIEKHFTLDRRGGGPDDSFSLEPSDLKKLCVGVRDAWEAMGSACYGCRPSEEPNLKFRRSLYFVEDLKKGQVIKPSSIRSVRPGYGLSPKFMDNIVGRKVLEDVTFGTPTSFEVIG